MVKRLLVSLGVGVAAGAVLDFVLVEWATWAACFSRKAMEAEHDLGAIQRLLVRGGEVISTSWLLVLPCAFLACVIASLLVGLATARKTE